MAGGDRCSVFGCNNDRRYPDRYVKKHEGRKISFYRCPNPSLYNKCSRLINRKDFHVTKNTMVCSNHFEDESDFQMASEDMEPPSKAPRLTDNNKSCNFSSPWHFSNVVLLVEGRKFHVHKSILSMWSPVFEKMFSSGFQEKKAKELISLRGKNTDEFELLLKMIYNFKNGQDINDENYEFLLKLADEYQVERVKKLCADHLSCNSLCVHNSIKICKIADQYALNDIYDCCIERASLLNMESIESSPCYSDVSDGMKLQILTKRIKQLEELLSNYSSTCSSLVDKAYTTISKKVHDCNCHRHLQAQNAETVGGVTQFKKFDIQCFLCLARLEKKWPEKDALVKYLKEPLKKLRQYKRDYEYKNYNCENESDDSS